MCQSNGPRGTTNMSIYASLDTTMTKGANCNYIALVNRFKDGSGTKTLPEWDEAPSPISANSCCTALRAISGSSWNLSRNMEAFHDVGPNLTAASHSSHKFVWTKVPLAFTPLSTSGRSRHIEGKTSPQTFQGVFAPILHAFPDFLLSCEGTKYHIYGIFVRFYFNFQSWHG